MALYRFGDRIPKIGEGAWISDSARVIGDVEVGEDCYIGHGVILRGDYGSIRIGPGTAIEENALVHINPDGLSTVGTRVTIGHGAVVHCTTIEDYAVIGMGAVLSFDVVIGEWAIVAEGCVVPARMTIPPGQLVVGVPAEIAGPIEDRHKQFWTYGKQLYVDLAHRYPNELERID